jgi:hypothetical protein
MATYRVPVLEDFAWQPPVNSRVQAPTGTEAKGTRYIILATTTGIFDGLGDSIATAKILNPVLLSDWYIDTPKEGHRCRVLDEDVDYLYNAGAWAAVPDNAALSVAISGAISVNVVQTANISSAVSVNVVQTADISTLSAGLSTNTSAIATKQDKGVYVSEYGAIEFTM